MASVSKHRAMNMYSEGNQNASAYKIPATGGDEGDLSADLSLGQGRMSCLNLAEEVELVVTRLQET